MLSMDAKEPSFQVPPAFPEVDVPLHHPHMLQEMALSTLTHSIMLVSCPLNTVAQDCSSQAWGMFGRTGYQGIGVKESSIPGQVQSFPWSVLHCGIKAIQASPAI